MAFPVVSLKERYLSINGTPISSLSKDASISVFDTSFHRGDGVFESMRIVPSSSNVDGLAVIRCLDQHMERLQTSAQAVGCPLPTQTVLIEWLDEAVQASGNQPGSLRLIATKGNAELGIDPSVVISWSPIPEWPETFTLFPVLAPWHPAGLPGWETPIKWTSYGPNVVSTSKAQERGFTDALLISPHRVERPVPPQTWSDVDVRHFHVLDGPNFAIAFVEKASATSPADTLHLPCNRTLGLLPSITQGRVAEIAKENLGMTVQKGVHTLGQMLDVAVEIFIMSTTRGVKRVTQIGDFSIPTSTIEAKMQDCEAMVVSWAQKFAELLENGSNSN